MSNLHVSSSQWRASKSGVPLKVSRKELNILFDDPRVQQQFSDHNSIFCIGIYNLYRTKNLSLSTVLDHLNTVENDYYDVSAKVGRSALASTLYDLLSTVPLTEVPKYINHNSGYVQAVVHWRLTIGK